jgi:hypothetical protein
VEFRASRHSNQVESNLVESESCKRECAKHFFALFEFKKNPKTKLQLRTEILLIKLVNNLFKKTTFIVPVKKSFC